MMKTFEQRKKEIRRRSEKRIAKRRRMVNGLTGTALCLLCVVIGVVALGPRAENSDTLANNAACEYAGMGNESASFRQESSRELPAGASPEAYHEDFTALKAEEISLRVEEIDTAADTLTLALTNNTCQQVSYGSGIDIEYETDGGWVSCAEAEMGWDAMLYLLEPGDTVTQEYALGGFDLSWSGTYRLVKYCNLYVEEDSTPCRVTAEFTVEEAP